MLPVPSGKWAVAKSQSQAQQTSIQLELSSAGSVLSESIHTTWSFKTFSFHRRIKRNTERESSLYYPAFLSCRRETSTHLLLGSRKKRSRPYFNQRGAGDRFHGVHFQQLPLPPSAFLKSAKLSCKSHKNSFPLGDPSPPARPWATDTAGTDPSGINVVPFLLESKTPGAWEAVEGGEMGDGDQTFPA